MRIRIRLQFYSLALIAAMEVVGPAAWARQDTDTTSNRPTVINETTTVAETGQPRREEPSTTVRHESGSTNVVTTTTTVTTSTTTIIESRDDPREVRAIRTYCADIDRFIRNNQHSRRDFIRRIDDSTGRWAGWAEVTNDRGAYLKAIAGAITYTRWGKVLFVECFSRNQPNRPSNFTRYYFRPDGTLAKSHTVLRTFSMGNHDGKVMVIMEFFQDKRGVSVGENVEYRHPKTAERVKPVKYGAQIQVGFSITSINRVRDLPFFELIQKPKQETSVAGKYTSVAGKYTSVAGKYTSVAGKYTSVAGKYSRTTIAGYKVTIELKPNGEYATGNNRDGVFKAADTGTYEVKDSTLVLHSNFPGREGSIEEMPIEGNVIRSKPYTTSDGGEESLFRYTKE